MNLITQSIVGWLSTYPWFATVLVIIGALRIIFLPLMTALEMIARTTTTDADDKAVAKAKKIGMFIFDLITSIQLPSKK